MGYFLHDLSCYLTLGRTSNLIVPTRGTRGGEGLGGGGAVDGAYDMLYRVSYIIGCGAAGDFSPHTMWQPSWPPSWISIKICVCQEKEEIENF